MPSSKNSSRTTRIGNAIFQLAPIRLVKIAEDDSLPKPFGRFLKVFYCNIEAGSKF